MLFYYPGVKAVLGDFDTADLLKASASYKKLWTGVLIDTQDYINPLTQQWVIWSNCIYKKHGMMEYHRITITTCI